MSEPETDVDTHLAQLDAKSSELTKQCHFLSAERIANEIRRTARAEQRLLPYIRATFTLLNHADSMLQPERAQKAAIEMIGLLESDERARAIQADFSEAEYSNYVYAYSSCAYDNLAKATALQKGYNSDGMHACIADGIQVCRRTGKMACVTCFREYATDVYRAADDLQMAIHFARAGVAHDKPGPHDRRWAGARDLVRLSLLQGELSSAAESLDLAWSLADTWHTPLHARIDTALLMQEVSFLLDEPSRWEKQRTVLTESRLPAGEYPWSEWRAATIEAIALYLQGDAPHAAELLSTWDRKLSQNRCLDEWMNNQLRLLAIYQRAGRQTEFTAVAEQLEAKARTSKDWLTLRCLERLRDRSVEPSLTPSVNGLPRTGAVPSQISAAETVAAESTKIEAASTEAEPEAAAEDGPPEHIMAFWKRMSALSSAESEAESSDDSLEKILADLLASNAPASMKDARWSLHTATYLIIDTTPQSEVWSWAKQITEACRRDAILSNLLAALAHRLHINSPEGKEPIVSATKIEQLFRESLDLDPNNVRNFGRAADFFLYQENFGEAERCLARGHRLNRSDTELAMKLASIYRRTERERDALAVLDLCLREGGDDPEVLWEAGLTAHLAESYAAAVTYFGAYEEQQPGRPWVHYYLASCLLEVHQFDEARHVVEIEAERNPDAHLAIDVLRAAAASGLGDMETAIQSIHAVLALKIYEIDYLTSQGISSLFGILWRFTSPVIEQSPELKQQIEDYMIASGLAPHDIFRSDRGKRETVEGMNFYVCELHQPLDERWANWPGRLEHEADWVSYTVPWGVLAANEVEAASMALAWQSRAFPLPPTAVNVQQQDSGYVDKPGVLWQGYRSADDA